ncbi:MAG: O-antigen ligase family protein [Candidatus Woykebacteria bacterium]
MNSSRISETIIEYTFYALFFLVPLIWLPVTSELFEFNKMILVYFGASIILTAWLVKTVSEGKFVYKSTPLDIPILLFLAANILSTIFSIEPHTSIFGHYSRFNGGLLSTISYIVLYFSFVTFFDPPAGRAGTEKVLRSLKFLLLSSTIVAIYAILQHPTPLFQNPDGSWRGIDAGFWQQDAEARAFSTLGHSNWLAAFLSMVIPMAAFFLLLAKKTWEKALSTVALIVLFLAFTFAYSRGASVGFVGMLLSALFLFLFTFKSDIKKFSQEKDFSKIKPRFRPPNTGFFLTILLVAWALILLLFGNALVSRGLNLEAIRATGDTQLATSGPETGRIRLIVWRGAFDIFKNYPLLGSGVETFAYSYYQHRPVEHNLTTEWNFLYNKAHNEFAHYLATTGILGIGTYLFLLSTLSLLVLKYLNQKLDKWKKIFIVLASSGLVGFHVQNLFGFSIVPIALLFYLTTAFIFVVVEDIKKVVLPLNIFRNRYLSLSGRFLAVFIGLSLITSVSAMWLADFFYNKGLSSPSYAASYDNLKTATRLRPDEPLYKANLGLVTMHLANDLQGREKKEKIAESFSYLNFATTTSPENISLWRIRLQAIYNLATSDPRYTSQVVATAQIFAALAPTEAEIQYNLASMYVFAQDFKKAQQQLEKVVALKFNYLDAWKLLFQVDSQLNDKVSKKAHFKKFKNYFPDQADNKEFLERHEIN